MTAKAKLTAIEWPAGSTTANDASPAHSVEVDFNPATLKLSYSNQNRSTDSPQQSSTQYAGKGSTKLTAELIFDSTTEGTDVREKTVKVSYFLGAGTETANGREGVPQAPTTPPGIRFEWGTLIVEGSMDSFEETLEYFSEEGVPLRSSVSISITQQSLFVKFGSTPPSAGSAGTTAMTPARQGDSVQSMAARAGKGDQWKQIAKANGISDPLRLTAGKALKLR